MVFLWFSMKVYMVYCLIGLELQGAFAELRHLEVPIVLAVEDVQDRSLRVYPSTILSNRYLVGGFNPSEKY